MGKKLSFIPTLKQDIVFMCVCVCVCFSVLCILWFQNMWICLNLTNLDFMTILFNGVKISSSASSVRCDTKGGTRGQGSTEHGVSSGTCHYNTGWLSIFQFHQFSSMNFRGQFQISRVGASLFSGGTVYVDVLMALYPELGVWSCRIIDSQPVYSFMKVRKCITNLIYMYWVIISFLHCFNFSNSGCMSV